MVEAEIKTTSGAIISVKGTMAEVNEILKFWQGREDFFKRRRIYMRSYDERDRAAHERQFPFFSTAKAASSPKARVMGLVEEGFLKEYRTLATIRNQIQKKYGQHISNGSLHPTLMLLIGQGILERQKQENDLWGYKKKEGENETEKH